jgi:hypothetical protein
MKRKRYFFYTSSYFDSHIFFGVCIDGQMFKAMNGQRHFLGPICLLEWIGTWGKDQANLVKSGAWKLITPEQARDTIPDGYRSNFPFPQLLKSVK